MNAPDREDRVILDEDEVKLIGRRDPKILNAVNFTIVKEDHTVGNMLRMQLLRYPDIRFAGYKIPHPLENLLEVKVQTDGTRDPLTAIKEATTDLLKELTVMETAFKNALGGRMGDGDAFQENEDDYRM